MSIVSGGITADHSASVVFTASKPPWPSGTETMNSGGSTTFVIARTITYSTAARIRPPCTTSVQTTP